MYISIILFPEIYEYNLKQTHLKTIDVKGIVGKKMNTSKNLLILLYLTTNIFL